MLFNNNTTTGSPLTYTRAGSNGTANISASLGLIQANADSTATSTTAVYTNAGGSWQEDFTIFNSFGPQGGTGTATFTFQLDGTITGGFLGVGNKVEFTASTPYDTTVADGFFDKDGYYGPLPSGQTFTVPISFTYGQPFTISGALTATADAPRSSGFGHVHVTLRQTGFTVTGGNYTAASATGAGSGANFAPGASYGGFTLTNTIGHLSTATLLDGTASTSRDASLTFVPADGTLPSVSDTISLSGTTGDVVVMQLGYDEAAVISQFGSENGLYLAWLNPASGSWQNAIDGNSAPMSNRIERAYNPLTDFTLGNWGEDPVNNTVWAVIDHNSEFTVASLSPTPEPGSALLLGLGGMLAGCRRRRSSSR